MTIAGWKKFYPFGKNEISPGNALGLVRYGKTLFEVDFVVALHIALRSGSWTAAAGGMQPKLIANSLGRLGFPPTRTTR